MLHSTIGIVGLLIYSLVGVRISGCAASSICWFGGEVVNDVSLLNMYVISPVGGVVFILRIVSSVYVYNRLINSNEDTQQSTGGSVIVFCMPTSYTMARVRLVHVNRI